MKCGVIILLLAGSFFQNCLSETHSLLEKIKTLSEEFDPDVVVPEYVPQIPDEIPDLEEIIERPEDAEEMQPRSGCKVNIKTTGSPQPLFLVPGTTKIWPFSDTGYMQFSVGENIELFCSSTFSNPVGKSGSQIATCVSGSTFKIGGNNYDFTKVVCSAWIGYSARKTGAKCNGGIVVESGFAVGSRFIKQLEICFDEISEVTRYVYHTLQPGSNYFQNNIARPNFITAGFFDGRNVDKLYTQASQTLTLNNELGGVAGSYIDTKANLFLARGHMAAKADFVYGTEQRGTFLFLNAAPQWQVFNAGNWQRVEDSVRTWVSNKKLNLNCWTGIYGVTSLPNKHGVPTPLYLDYDENHNGLIPVPMLYFRVIIEPSTKRGVVLIGVNNPHLTLADIKKDYILCKDVSDKITWLKWKKDDIRAGYSYACEVQEFAKKNPNLPKFEVTSLLY